MNFLRMKSFLIYVEIIYSQIAVSLYLGVGRGTSRYMRGLRYPKWCTNLKINSVKPPYLHRLLQYVSVEKRAESSRRIAKCK